MDSGSESSKTLSLLISKSLCLSGFSNFATQLAKYKTLTLHHLFFSLTEELQRFEGGSVSEGTVTSESDADCMFVVPDILVKSSVGGTKDEDVTGDVFVLDTSESVHGYARLRLLELSDTDNCLLSSYNADIRDLLEHTKEGEFLSSEKFVNFFMSVEKHEDSYRHGPCSTTEHVDVHGYIEGKPGKSVEADTAHALCCSEWPSEAKQWTVRNRFHGWPEQLLTDKICNTKCYVVPIGNPLSKHHAQEWRVSFLLGERELVWGFNDTQIHCYFLLKRLVKLFLDKVAPDQISSYHMKTIVFWISEENGLSMWYPENLLRCIEICLDKLSKSVSEKKLKQFFNSQANLFGHKFETETQKEQVEASIDDIKAHLSSFVLQCMPSHWQWPNVWERCSSNINCLVELSTDAEDLVGDHFATAQMVNNVRHLYRVMFNILLQVTTNEPEPEFILRQLIAFEKNPPEQVAFLFIEMTKIYLDLRLALAYFREMAVHENEAFRNYLESKSISTKNMVKMAAHACMMDAMSGHLYLASIHHILGEFTKSIEIIETLLHQHKHLVYPGYCSKYTGIRLLNNGISNQEMGTKFQGEEGRTFVAFDMIFSYKDVHCVPYPVKFECAIAQVDNNFDDFVVIHPSVYAYFLLCYGQYNKGQHSSFKETLTLFQKAVDETEGGRERHHALNILSFCYLLDDNLQTAFGLLKESLLETDAVGIVPNAAAYHIALILHKVFEKRKRALKKLS